MGAGSITMDILSVLANSGIFNRVSEETLETLAKTCEVQVFEDGEVIFREGEIEPRGLFVLAGGEVIVTTELVEKLTDENSSEKKEFFITSLHPGDTFGEISILDSGPRSATTKASGLTTVCFIPEKSILGLVETDTMACYYITLNISRIVCNRLREADFAFKYKSLLG